MSGIVHPKPGDLLHLRGGMLISVIVVRWLSTTPQFGRSMWAVDAEVVGARKRRWLGKVDTWHLSPGDFAVEPQEGGGDEQIRA